MIPVALIINSITFVFYSIIIIISIIDSSNLLGSLFIFRVSVVFSFLRLFFSWRSALVFLICKAEC